jgi:hypothetical protein
MPGFILAYVHTFFGVMLFRNHDESFFERLEREAGDDFGLLKDIGPEYFSSAHLLELREEIRRRLDRFDRTKKLIMLLGALSAGGFLGGVVCLFLDWTVMAFILYGISTACILAFIVGSGWLKWKYDSRGELMHTLLEVEEELRNRAALKGRGAPLR